MGLHTRTAATQNGSIRTAATDKFGPINRGFRALSPGFSCPPPAVVVHKRSPTTVRQKLGTASAPERLPWLAWYVTPSWKRGRRGLVYPSAPSPISAGSRSASTSGTVACRAAAPGSRAGLRTRADTAKPVLGLADDTQDADGDSVLDYSQAQQAARSWWQAELRKAQGHDAPTGPLTVAEAVTDYLKALERRGGKSAYHARRAAEVHIIPALGALPLAKLKAQRIEDWHQGLAEKPPLARTKPGKKQNHRKINNSAEGIRSRRATANRVMTVLKAALNRAWNAGQIASDDAWRRVKPFRG